jgi:hypothetical protein
MEVTKHSAVTARSTCRNIAKDSGKQIQSDLQTPRRAHLFR